MYDELVKRLREQVKCDKKLYPQGAPFETLLLDLAADAIEELSKPKWIKIESRPMTEEERKEWSEQIGYDIEYEDAIIYTSGLPDDGQEVLVCNKWGQVWIDTFSNDPDYGVGFETNGDMDGLVAWMPLPKPFQPQKEE